MIHGLLLVGPGGESRAEIDRGGRVPADRPLSPARPSAWVAFGTALARHHLLSRRDGWEIARRGIAHLAVDV
jgi:hypothetical protein